MLKTRIIIALITLFLFSGYKIPEREQECKQLLLDYFKGLSKFDIPEGKKTYYMKMRMKSTLAPQLAANTYKGNQEVTLSLFMTKNELVYESNYISIYSDQQNSFMVVHPQKIIIWNNGGKEMRKNIQLLQVAKLQQQIITGSRLKQCEEIDYKGKKIKLLTMEPPAAIREKDKLKLMRFYYNKSKKMVEKIKLTFEKGNDIQYQEINYDAMSFNYIGFKNVAAKRRIFSTGSRLNKRYQGYTIEDKRETKVN